MRLFLCFSSILEADISPSRALCPVPMLPEGHCPRVRCPRHWRTRFEPAKNQSNPGCSYIPVQSRSKSVQQFITPSAKDHNEPYYKRLRPVADCHFPDHARVTGFRYTQTLQSISKLARQLGWVYLYMQNWYTNAARELCYNLGCQAHPPSIW